MSTMTAVSRPLLHPLYRSQSPSNVPTTVLQPNNNNRPTKRKRDHSPRRTTSPIKKRNSIDHARQSLITSHYPARLPLLPPPQQTPVNTVTKSSLADSLGAPSVLKDNGFRNVGSATCESYEEPSKQDDHEVGKKMEEKRSLRSHNGGSRSKSELAQYFANYEDILSLKSKESGKTALCSLTVRKLRQSIDRDLEILNPDTRLFITDAAEKAAHSFTSSSHHPTSDTTPLLVNGKQRFGEAQQKLCIEEIFAKNGVERINLAVTERPFKLPKEDPLSDEFYFKAHRRAQRQEKSARNIEKERAMHEKVQLETLLEDLKGHDWLKVMGVGGITDGEKKLYEPKRQYFIHEVEVLIEKFRLWKEEEKRRKVVKEKEDEDISETESSIGHKTAKLKRNRIPAEITLRDVDDAGLLAAQQLQEEASASSSPQADQSLATRKRKRRTRPLSVSASRPQPEPKSHPREDTKQSFGSFFQKSYQRDAALGSHRRGRARLAFGQLVPEPHYIDFGLSEDILTPEVIQVMDRRRRIVNRDKDTA